MSTIGIKSVLVVAALVSLAESAAAADEAPALVCEPATFHVDPPAEQAAAAPTQEAHAAFGAKGSHWLTFGAGVADNFSDSVDTKLNLAWSTFLVQDVEFSLEGAGWYFNQPGDNTGGVSVSMLFRWHFVDTGKWTVYADVGVGVLGAFDDVPQEGTSFDFLPQAGMGFTRKLYEDSDTRLQMGVHWHHISNARINGDEDNPARDGAMFYAALIFPF